jgi:CRP/FNR family transcriptional regulator, cyclic AMP receptor protein
MAAVIVDRVSTLRHAPIFRALSEGDLTELAQTVVVRRLRNNELLVFEGEPGTNLFVLAEGIVRIFREGSDGREQVVRIEREVATLNETHIFENRPHAVSISACPNAVVLSLSLNDVRQRIQHSPRAALDALQLLSERLHKALDLVDSLSLLSVDQRVAQFLLEEARRKRNRFCPELQAELTLSNQQIGAMVGAVREVVSRSLSKLRRQGLVLFEGRTVTIPDESRLERFIDGRAVAPMRRTAVF